MHHFYATKSIVNTIAYFLQTASTNFEKLYLDFLSKIWTPNFPNAYMHTPVSELAICTFYTAVLQIWQFAGNKSHARHGSMRSVEMNGLILEKLEFDFCQKIELRFFLNLPCPFSHTGSSSEKSSD